MASHDLDNQVAELVRAVLRENGRPPPDGQGNVSLDSLAVVALVDALEQGLDIRLRPEDLTADALASVASVTLLCRRRGATDPPP